VTAAAPEQYDSSFHEGAGFENSSDTLMQPFMDFMMQDLDSMPFGMLDESWLGIQHVNTSMGFDTQAQMSVGVEQAIVR
jgi:hypothetical protein